MLLRWGAGWMRCGREKRDLHAEARLRGLERASWAWKQTSRIPAPRFAKPGRCDLKFCDCIRCSTGNVGRGERRSRFRSRFNRLRHRVSAPPTSRSPRSVARSVRNGRGARNVAPWHLRISRASKHLPHLARLVCQTRSFLPLPLCGIS